MKYLLLPLLLLGSCEKPRLPDAYRIVTPDSLASVRGDLREVWHRWNSWSPLSFTFSDSGAKTLYFNDSLTYHNDLYEVTRDSICVLGECVERDGSILAVREGVDLRFIHNRKGRFWYVFSAIGELLNHLPSADRAVLLIANRRTVLQSYRTNGTWVDEINVFGKMREYHDLPDSEERYFKLHGPPIRFSENALTRSLTPFGNDRLQMLRPTIYTYPDYETKALLTGNVLEYHFDETSKAIHMVVNGLTEMRFNEILCLYYATRIYGNTYLAESYGLWQSGSYFGKSFEWWKKKRPLLNLVNKLELTGTPSPTLNPFLRHALGLWFWETRSQEAGIILGNPARFLNAFIPAIPPPEQKRPPAARLPFFKGVCFAHTNGSDQGYMSQQSTSSLEAAADLGVNAVSLTPFGYSKTETDPEIQFVLNQNWDETAGSLFKATEDAHRLNLHVMLKPHLWLGNGTWCGKIEMATPQDVRRWMKSYSEFITYHALLAELAGMNSLCLATELERMAGHTDSWKEIVTLVRYAYSGPITYAANWSGEFDSVGFWQELDFIGVNHYFPLASVENPTEEHLRIALDSAAQQLQRLSARHEKKVVLTEVGFASSTVAFITPHDEDYSKPASQENQALGYRLIFETYEKKPWFGGFFWWKWESGSARRYSEKSFHFRGKAAEMILRSYYTGKK